MVSTLAYGVALWRVAPSSGAPPVDSAANHDVLTVCLYDLSRFGGDVVMDMLRTHPYALVGGIFYEKPYYSPRGRAPA